MAETKELLKWRAKQKKGAIMKPQTFEKIKESAIKKGLSESKASSIAGKAYWKTAEKKYEKSKKK